MTYMVFDSETTIHKTFKRTANPFDEKNSVVARGWKIEGDTQCSWKYYPGGTRKEYLRIPEHVTMLVGFNIKFDLLYEMVCGNPDLLKFFQRGGKIWDGQYAEYFIGMQDQDVQMCSLNDTAPKYGGTTKIDAVKAMWEQGINTTEIPEDLLIDYLVGTEEELRDAGDIGNTEKTYLGQLAKIKELGMLNMVEDRFDGLLCTTEMEYRGLKIDVEEAGRRLTILNNELVEANAELLTFIPADLPFEFNWNSPIHASALIFGGTAKYEKPANYLDESTGELARLKASESQPLFSFGGNTITVPVASTTGYDDVRMLYYIDHTGGRLWQDTFAGGARKGSGKSKKVDIQGELKTRITPFYYTFPGYTKPKEEWAGKREDAMGAPLYSTATEVMEVLAKRDMPFTRALGRKQKLDKEIGTYYVRWDPKKKEYTGMLSCVQPWDFILHHNLNHTSTVTSRLSSSAPNLQNLPRNDKDERGEQKSQVKQMFVSRFGDDGQMVEADYSQLEVVVQGVLSGDWQLCEHLRQRVDFHCIRVAAKFKNSASPITYEAALEWCKNEKHPDYTNGKKERTKCKIFSFQRAYGAGADTIADETGMDVDEVKELMAAEDELYPGVVAFNKDVEASCMRTAKPFQAANDNGEWQTFRRGHWVAPTGTRYSWRSYEAQGWQKKRGITDSFNPPEMKNYPVQGTGGEFVQAILGLLWRHFISNNFYGGKAFLVNTVHDCVWVDCHKDVLDQVCSDLKRIMESIPEYYNGRYGMNITVPFPVEVEHGNNMNTLHHFDFKAAA